MPHQKQPLRLFVVTLPWNPSDEEEGDYSNKTWAVDDDAAIRNIAEEMADSGEKHHDSDEERDQFVKTLVEAAGPYAAECVGDRLLTDVHDLLTGTDDTISHAAKADFDTIAAVLVNYGIFNPHPAK
jgi:hypothetical protein